MDAKPDPAGPRPQTVRRVEERKYAWEAFIQFCRELHHGEIEKLSIQDGVPVLAEVTKKKIKFV